MEDTMALLQTRKHLATAVFRRQSISFSGDIFFFSSDTFTDGNQPQTPPRKEFENICHLLSHIKLLLCRKTAATAALEVGLYIDALSTRASLFESIWCLPDSLHDLEHLKLLYNPIIRNRKLVGPVWKRQSIRYREIPWRLCSLATKSQELKQKRWMWWWVQGAGGGGF
ncbi:hypothetical protein Hanom_Chr14g01285281 [Helianthus anomalus]